jgi:hypothetical protein
MVVKWSHACRGSAKQLPGRRREKLEWLNVVGDSLMTGPYLALLTSPARGRRSSSSSRSEAGSSVKNLPVSLEHACTAPAWQREGERADAAVENCLHWVSWHDCWSNK